MTKLLVAMFTLAATAATTHAADMPLIAPDAVVKTLNATNKPLLIHVGFETLYQHGHIPGSQYIGPAKDKEALKRLHAYADKLPRDREIVIYCGCCPMTKCPNVHPAFTELQAMGFKNLKVLDLPDSFSKDWVKKGYPIEK